MPRSYNLLLAGGAANTPNSKVPTKAAGRTMGLVHSLSMAIGGRRRGRDGRIPEDDDNEDYNNAA